MWLSITRMPLDLIILVIENSRQSMSRKSCSLHLGPAKTCLMPPPTARMVFMLPPSTSAPTAPPPMIINSVPAAWTTTSKLPPVMA